MSEVIYREVSIANMSSSIPTDWQTPDDSEEMIEISKNSMGAGMGEYTEFNAFEVPESSDTILLILITDFKEWYEEQGLIWKGWEKELEAYSMTIEDYASLFTAGFIGAGAQKITQEQSLGHTIAGCEAVETVLTYEVYGQEHISYCLLILEENSMAFLMLTGEKNACEKQEEHWNMLRDSIQFHHN
jgi:hypothetical protein